MPQTCKKVTDAVRDTELVVSRATNVSKFLGQAQELSDFPKEAIGEEVRNGSAQILTTPGAIAGASAQNSSRTETPLKTSREGASADKTRSAIHAKIGES